MSCDCDKDGDDCAGPRYTEFYLNNWKLGSNNSSDGCPKAPKIRKKEVTLSWHRIFLRTSSCQSYQRLARYTCHNHTHEHIRKECFCLLLFLVRAYTTMQVTVPAIPIVEQAMEPILIGLDIVHLQGCTKGSKFKGKHGSTRWSFEPVWWSLGSRKLQTHVYIYSVYIYIYIYVEAKHLSIYSTTTISIILNLCVPWIFGQRKPRWLSLWFFNPSDLPLQRLQTARPPPNRRRRILPRWSGGSRPRRDLGESLSWRSDACVLQVCRHN